MKKIKILQWILLLFLVSTLNIYGQKALDKYLKYAAENNQALKAKFNEYLAYMKEIPQVDALPDPNIAFGYFISPVETRVGSQQFKVSLKQKFPWFGKLDARGKTKGNLAEVKLKEFEAIKDKLYFNVKNAWYNIYLIAKDILLVQKQIDFYKSIEDLIQIKFESGSQGLSEIIRIKIKLKDYENKLNDLNIKINPYKSEFNKLLDRRALTEVDLADTLWLDKFDLNANTLDSIYQSNTNLKVLKQLKKTAESNRSLAELEGYPDIGISLDYTTVNQRLDLSIPKNGQDIFMPMLSFNIPINRNKYDSKVQEYDIQTQMFDNKINDYKNQINSDFQKAIADYQNSKRNIVFINGQIKQSYHVLNLLLTDYSSSGRGFIDMILIKEKILEYEFQLDKEKVNLNMAVASLKLLNSKI